MELQKQKQQKTLIVIILTVITMLVEVMTGYLSHSMALLADGLHMGTHSLALGITFMAYYFSYKVVNPEKLQMLGGYTSSIFLGLTGVWIIIESVERFINPLQIEFTEAIIVATIGLLVNIVSIIIMGKDGHSHSHDGEHNHSHGHEENMEEHAHIDSHCSEDFNFKAAYLHILADILTSVMAIIAILAAKFLNLLYLDSFVGILGGIVILRWSYGLIKSTGKALLS